jgi:glycosyltransferase involved in cell wall biosynthesis
MTMRIIIAKFSAWSYEDYKKSEHPEYVAIRNIVEEHPEHKFTLIGDGHETRHFTQDGIEFYNIYSKGRSGYFLSSLLKLELAILLRPSVIVVMGNVNLIPFGLETALKRTKLLPVITGEIGYSMHSVPNPIRATMKCLLKATLRRSKTILSLSKSIQGELVSGCGIDPKKIIVYKYRISEAFNPTVSKNLKATLNPNGPVVLTLCRISKEKGLEYLIEATRQIVKRMPNVRVIIKGSTQDPKYKQKLATLVQKYKLDRNIGFSEFSPYSEVPKFLAASDVFVLPSISEGLGLVIMEAMASGVPVVASRVGGVPDILTDGFNGLMVDPAKPALLADALLRLLEDPELRRRLIEKGFETVRRMEENEIEKLLNRFMFQE